MKSFEEIKQIIYLFLNNQSIIYENIISKKRITCTKMVYY